MLYHLARAARCSNLPLMIKLDEEGQGFWAQAALGAGFKSILFTDIRTPDDINTCHKVIRPDDPNVGGRMGLKLRRPALSSYEPEGYLNDLNSIVFCVMLEKQIAVENIHNVLLRAKERSIDMIQWGPADYSITRGRPHMMYEADIMPIEKMVIEKCLEYGVAPRIEIGNVEQAKRYIGESGISVLVGTGSFCKQA